MVLYVEIGLVNLHLDSIGGQEISDLLRVYISILHSIDAPKDGIGLKIR